MSQVFNLQLAQDDLNTAANTLGVSIEQLQDIKIQVRVSIKPSSAPHNPEAKGFDEQLWFHYCITLPSSILAKQLDWTTWQQDNVGFTDYLWEQTCLECFMSNRIDDDSSYIEINVNPNGQYALYHFHSYRSPSTRPPAPLMAAQQRANLIWPSMLSSPATYKQGYRYHCSFGFDLNQLPSEWFIEGKVSSTCPKNMSGHPLYSNVKTSNPSNQSKAIGYIQPCVILWFGTTDLYFAPVHATPPDFHQRHLWPCFDHQAASAL
ncbi:hypothetical protein J3492_06565 [Psychrobacter sp. F1192]|uniref:Uncharacterized protein n=1 Tax=Psychrobacter coccoides TaxID=2818440 RepID=A0ABS3NNA1_9GAMM|nr:hypothetical protein [Psychrobacter coccoides]MBO1530876.1 hypothetical protein [Psychrobacter coccoides]